MNKLNVAVVPLDIVWTDISENLFSAERQLSTLPSSTDVAVLPELFSTGFIATSDLLDRFAESVDNSETLRRVQHWAKKFNFAVAGSYLAKDENNSIFNRAFFVEPSGETTVYDKHHLFSLSSESQNFTPGMEHIPVIRFRGWNIALAICYELRFPEWLRNKGQMYDLLILPANWPARRAYAWEHLLIARAIENQAFVVGANRSGHDDSGDYDNLSMIFDYLGKPIHNVCKGSSHNILATMDLSKLEKFRQSFPIPM